RVSQAVDGQGGGVIGWGVRSLFALALPSPADAFALGAGFLIGLLLALDITADRFNRLLEWLRAQGFENDPAGRQLPLPLDNKTPAAAPAARRPLPVTGPRPDKPKLARGERLRIPVETVSDEVKGKPKKRDKRLPGYDLLDETDLRKPAEKEINETAGRIVKTLKEFGVPVHVLGARVGPSVTQYQVEPGFVEKAGPATGSAGKLLEALHSLGQFAAEDEPPAERELMEQALHAVHLFSALGYETESEEYVEQSRNAVFLRNAKGRTLVIMEFRRPGKALEVSGRQWDEDPLPEVGAVCNGHELWICRFDGKRMAPEPLAQVSLAEASEADARLVQTWLGKKQQWKVRVAQIATLKDDLALALSANTLRIEAPVPGQSYVGIEVPHRRTSIVGVRPVMEAEAFQKLNKPLAVALGRDVSGGAVASDLGSMPHLLIAGTTGSGKSVCIVSLVTCLVMNNTPDDLRLVMIDPKMVELVRFNGLPHLLGKVETELTRILGVLRWTVREMDRRYKLFEAYGARNLDTYHAKIGKAKDGERLPRIVVFIDELADLMMQAPDETERMVVRLAQMARATGIHLVVATQRPSTDVVTGLIKANFPARIAFAVVSGIDSRVILDTVGAESLLGKGDMLFQSSDTPAPQRLQGCFVGDKEIDRVVGWWKEQAEAYEDEAQPEFEPVKPGAGGEAASDRGEAVSAAAPVSSAGGGAAAAPWDEMLAREQAVEDKDQQIEQAIEIVKKYGTASASLLQRKMRIGYPRAARLMDELKQMGIIGREQQGGKTREVFISKDDDPIGERAARILGGEDDDDE
ncbi:MAG: DNA translocase FtsK, partial [Anaerolineales bacterium]|nr:DNA translocase FtsK [Anaerolineales bacterium]